MKAPSKIHTQSRILQTFRALGVVASDVPVDHSRTGFVTAAIGRSFQVYDTDKLTPVAVSSQLPKKIRAVVTVVAKNQTFCAVGRDIHVFERVREVSILRGHVAAITQLLAVGDALFSIGEDRTLRVWSISDLELLNTITFDAMFTPTVLLHPATYLNKVIVGSAEGAIQLWNVRTLKCIYSFKGWGSEITSLAQSPAVDVAAIGLADGRIFIHNLKFDTTLMTFAQTTEGRVTSLSFRNDDKSPWLASGTSSGDVILWNLETQRLQAKIPVAHDADVATVYFLPSEPVLLTSSGDNSIKLWIFDQLDQSARLLKSRQGHKAPPTKIRYYGHNIQKDGMVCQILSASQDRSFRMFHTAREQQSAELSQGPLLKKVKRNTFDMKLSPIVQMAAIDTREKDWPNVVTCHQAEPAAYVWSIFRKAIGKKVLQQVDDLHDEKNRHYKATSVAISACGNFALVGSLGGAIYLYNIQSGEKRGSFPTAATAAPQLIKALTMPGASYVQKPDHSAGDKHTGAVSGVVVDALNTTVVSSGLDGQLKFWDFSSHTLTQSLDLGSPITHLDLHKESGFVVATCDDFVLRVVDIATRKIVRRLRGHTHVLTDVCFSPDARWLVSSSADGSLRIWDLPTGKCVDYVKFKHAVTSVAMSPTGEFIATCHTSQVGIFLWANRAYFENVFLDAEPTEPILMGMPLPLSEEEMPLDVTVDHAGETTTTDQYEAPTGVDRRAFVSPIAPSSLVTLSTAPKAMWQSLFQLELIKKRNKPKEAPKAPEQAPFFLPTIRKDDVHPTFESTMMGGASDKKAKQVEAKKTKDEPSMDGWGDNDDEAWGDADDDDNDAATKPVVASSRIVKSTGLTSSRSKLASLLDHHAQDDQILEVDGIATVATRHPIMAYLQTLSASGVDVELSTLCMGEFDAEGKQHLHWFLDFLLVMVQSRQQFQVVQVYLNRFLKVHEDIVVADTALLAKVQALHAKQQAAWEHLQHLLQHNLCLVQYLSKMQM
ncbi:Aste57867_14833 [Aphanomyces stellatus]|uniref:Aste57867_14833 protein n=1 Tax=Aphanomyces stellatus TaxID=120398 RepID=A0A485L1Q0_9STRA|nr:hypothetical protein As57867_014777 [Aphanomyces stellatus]VFT91651.1 Aste57867_14833 [Aphanomyces stellatus]